MNHQHPKLALSSILFSLFIVSSCINKSGDSIPGINSLVEVVEEPAGTNCSSGGVKIITGQDLNASGTLDEEEISTTSYVCDGDSDGIHEFYFTQGIDGYDGVTECVIYDYPEPLGLTTLMAGYFTFELDYTLNTLIRFEGLETIFETVSSEFEIVEATLFLRGALSQTYYGNRLAVSHLSYPSDEILFQADATWNYRTAVPTEAIWPNSQSFSSEETEGIYDIFEMQLRGFGDTPYTGIIPLSLDRSSVSQWVSGNNPGVALSLLDDIIELNELLTIYPSDDANIYNRPTLYLKIKEVSTPSARTRPSNESAYKDWWQSLSYEQKIAPMLRRSNR